MLYVRLGEEELTMTGILNSKTKVHVTGEVDTELYLGYVLDVD
jgi:hypothetical protein